jgi:hypothetical protein
MRVVKEVELEGLDVPRKTRYTFFIEPEVLARLQSVTDRTGLSKSDEIRQGIRGWLESREWPGRKQAATKSPQRRVR